MTHERIDEIAVQLLGMLGDDVADDEGSAVFFSALKKDGKDTYCAQCIQVQTGKTLLAAAEGLAQLIVAAGQTWPDCQKLTEKFADMYGARLKAVFAQKTLDSACAGGNKEGAGHG